MDPNWNQFHFNSRRNNSSTDFRHGLSTAQVCLSKILRIISSFPPSDSTSIPANAYASQSEEEFRVSGEGRDFFDLNVEFRSSPEEAVGGDGKMSSVQSNSEDSGVVVKSDLNGLVFAGDAENEKSSEVECDVKESAMLNGIDSTDSDAIKIEEEEEEPAMVEFEGKVAKAEQSLGIGSNGVSAEIREDDGSLGMLIEAARMILGAELAAGERNRRPESVKEDTNSFTEALNNEVQVQPSSRRRSKRKAEEMEGELADTTPPSPPALARSKRGRTRMLPCKYRDSILEPLTALCRHKTAAVPVRRKSR